MPCFRTLLLASALAVGIGGASAHAQSAKPTSVPSSRAALASLTRIYQFSGVLNSAGGANAGTGTVFYCTNFSDATLTVRFLLRDRFGMTLSDSTRSISAKRTFSYATKSLLSIDEDVANDFAAFAQGSMVIAATETEILCNAAVIKADLATMEGYALTYRRFVQMPGAQE